MIRPNPNHVACFLLISLTDRKIREHVRILSSYPPHVCRVFVRGYLAQATKKLGTTTVGGGRGRGTKETPFAFQKGGAKARGRRQQRQQQQQQKESRLSQKHPSSPPKRARCGRTYVQYSTVGRKGGVHLSCRKGCGCHCKVVVVYIYSKKVGLTEYIAQQRPRSSC